MWIYLLIAGIVLYALIKEREALGCTFDTRDCDNSNGKALKGTKCDSSDPTDTVFCKLRDAADFSSKWVIWRLALLASVVATFLIFLFLYQRVPEEIELAVSMFIVTCVIYFTVMFYQFHLIGHVKKHLHDGLDILESRIPTR